MEMAEQVEYTKITPDRYDDVIKHLRYNFFADEPLNKSLSLSKPGEEIPELEEYSRNMMKQEMSSMATLGSEVIGAVLLGRVTTGGISNVYQDPKLSKIFAFINDMANNCDYGDGIESKDIIDLKMISVDEKMRGKRVASRLYEICEQTSYNNGYKVIRAEVTALYSQKILINYGWDTIKEVRYSEYPNPDEPAFPVAPPNQTFKIMTKRLK